MLICKRAILPLSILLATSVAACAQEPATTDAFLRYIASAENRIDRDRHSSFLQFDSLPPSERNDTAARLKRGEVVIEKEGKTPEQIPDGLIHDWVGTVFIPNASVSQVVAFVRDYNRTARYYSPDVLQSRLLSAKGDDLHVFMRLRKHNVITVVLDTEYDVHYGRIDAAHQYSTSRSTRISEIADAGSSNERPLPPGHDHGFLWRLNTYWAFEQSDGGVFVQCEAISLTRNIPTGLAWMIGPFINSIPRESLQFTLDSTRRAMTQKTTIAQQQN